jgi:hypothetical protein
MEVMSDPLVTLLGELPLADPDRARADHTRARCRARLARLRGSQSSSPISRRRLVALWQPVIATLAVAYVAEAIVLAIRAYAAH